LLKYLAIALIGIQAISAMAQDCANVSEIKIYGEFHDSIEGTDLRTRIGKQVLESKDSIVLYEGIPNLYNDSANKPKHYHYPTSLDGKLSKRLNAKIFGAENFYHRFTVLLGTVSVHYRNVASDRGSLDELSDGITFIELFLEQLYFDEIKDHFLPSDLDTGPYSEYANALRGGDLTSRLEYLAELMLSDDKIKLADFSDFLIKRYNDSVLHLQQQSGPTLFPKLTDEKVSVADFFEEGHLARESSMVDILKDIYCKKPGTKIHAIYGDAHLEGLKKLIAKNPVLAKKPIEYIKSPPPTYEE